MSLEFNPEQVESTDVVMRWVELPCSNTVRAQQAPTGGRGRCRQGVTEEVWRCVVSARQG